MENQQTLNDVRFLRDVIARTQPAAVNHYWAVSVMWGCVVTMGYLLCAVLGINGKTEILPWVWPVLIVAIAWPLHWYLVRKVKSEIAGQGIRPRFRKDLMICWSAITIVGLLWTAAMIFSGAIADHWYVLLFLWGSLQVVGYVMNGVLLSQEWFWAAAVLSVALIGTFAAGPDFYWIPGLSIGAALIFAGFLGRRNVRLRA